MSAIRSRRRRRSPSSTCSRRRGSSSGPRRSGRRCASAWCAGRTASPPSATCAGSARCSRSSSWPTGRRSGPRPSWRAPSPKRRPRAACCCSSRGSTRTAFACCARSSSATRSSKRRSTSGSRRSRLPWHNVLDMPYERTVALVARDGAIDWLCLPDLDSPSVFGALLDAERGGRFALRPTTPFDTARCYVPGTNVLETTFTTATGVVRVTDALTLPTQGLSPYRELVRRVEALSGSVPMEWLVEPRFGYTEAKTKRGHRGRVPVATSGRDALAVLSWDAGDGRWNGEAITGSFTAAERQSSLLVLSVAHQEPLVLPSRPDVEERLAATARTWRDWVEGRDYEGPWGEAVLRSALALKLLVFAPSGAIAAAATTSLPEAIGGERNWDYRFTWPRDSAFTLDALLQLGCLAETHSFFWWLLHASQLTHPRLQVLYRLDGRVDTEESSMPLQGYCESRPVRVGNGASTQTQLDVYGEVLQAIGRFADFDRGLDRETGRELAAIADLVCEIWRRPDRGIWEVRMAPLHFTHSKAMCWIALERATRLAEAGCLPARRVSRWRAEAEAIRAFVEARCWSARKQSYVPAADEEELDASLLLMALMRYHDPR